MAAAAAAPQQAGGAAGAPSPRQPGGGGGASPAAAAAAPAAPLDEGVARAQQGPVEQEALEAQGAQEGERRTARAHAVAVHRGGGGGGAAHGAHRERASPGAAHAGAGGAPAAAHGPPPVTQSASGGLSGGLRGPGGGGWDGAAAAGAAAAAGLLARGGAWVHLEPGEGLFISDPERHDSGECTTHGATFDMGLVGKWRNKDRMKTVSVALVLCLNVGVDPPDLIRTSPCARRECWVEPSSMVAPKAIETIGKTLQAQYERWQPRARYRLSLDPTVEEVKKLCLSCRRNARGERVLFHYNGHGVPKPTINGEIWVFNKQYTQYIPLSLYELQAWLGTPSIYVFDCNAAGIVVQSFVQFAEQRRQEVARMPAAQTLDASGQPQGAGSAGSGEYILLAPCGANERLPQEASLPADVFTSCLTTPIKIALRWFLRRSLLAGSVTPEMVDAIPGRQNDRKTPLGELNWIFTAITDTIAWNTLPRPLFQKLFRQDLLVASLFRNFLLADRILRSLGCTPVSYPVLPPTHNHPMWQAWDLAAEMCLVQLARAQGGPSAALGAGAAAQVGAGAHVYAAGASPSPHFTPSVFFSEQLTAFEVWLGHGSKSSEPPEQLPIVLQVLLSQSHRQRALVLLGRFLDMGPWAVDLALSVGIFPYILKLLQGTELRQELIFIWAKILALDRKCQLELVKDGGHLYFIKFLRHVEAPEVQRATAAFVLAVIVDGNERGQAAAVQANLLAICLGCLQRCADPQLMKWLALCLGKLWGGSAEACALGLREGAPSLLQPLLGHHQPEVRAAAVFALGQLIIANDPAQRRMGAAGTADGSAGSVAGSQGGSFMAGGASSGSQGSLLASGGDGGAASDAVAGGAHAARQTAPPGATGVGGAAMAPPPLRLATERLIGFELISMTLDASPMVRAELAAALARLLSGHVDAFRVLAQKEAQQTMAQQTMLTRAASVPHNLGSVGGLSSPMMAVHALGRRGEAAMRAASPSPTVTDQPLRAAIFSERPVTEEMPSAAASSAGGAGDEAGAGSAPGPSLRGMLRPDSVGKSGLSQGGSDANVCSGDGEVEGEDNSESDTEGSAHGGTLMGEDQVYTEVLASVVALARDPAPRVAMLGCAALAAAGIEGMGGLPRRQQEVVPEERPKHRRSGSGSKWGLTRIASWTTRSKKSTPDSSMRGGTAVGSHLQAIGAGGTPPSPASFMSRLGRLGIASGSTPQSMSPPIVSPHIGPETSRQSTLQFGTPDAGGPLSTSAGSGGVPAVGGDGASAGEQVPGELPKTNFYKWSCQYFSRPILDTSEAMEARERALMTIGLGAPSSFAEQQQRSGSIGGGSRASTPRASTSRSGVRAPLPPQRLVGCAVPAPPADGSRSQREDWAAAAVQRCLDMRPTRMEQLVASFELPGASVTSLLADPFSPLVCVGDSRGRLSLWDFEHNAVVNALGDRGGAAGIGGSSAIGGGGPVYGPIQQPRGSADGAVEQLCLLNEFDCRLVAAGHANGTVKVWHSATRRGGARLATAFNALPDASKGIGGGTAPRGTAGNAQADSNRRRRQSSSRHFVMDFQQLYGRLFTAGAASDAMLVWDLASERLAARLPLHTTVAPTALCARPARDEVALVGFADGSVRCFDPRTGAAPVCISRPHSKAVVRVAAEPGRAHGGHVVSASAAGDISLWDVRNTDAGPLCRIAAHQSAMTAAAVHPHAPLLATASASAHIKVFDLKGEQLSCIRYTNSFLGSRITSVGCLAFHPYGGVLVTGSLDGAVSVYSSNTA